MKRKISRARNVRAVYTPHFIQKNINEHTLKNYHKENPWILYYRSEVEKQRVKKNQEILQKYA